MYPSQRLDSVPPHPDVCSCSREIILLAREIVDNGHVERKFMVFPLFMAGFVANNATDRTEVLELLTVFEQKSMGRVASASRELLETVYRMQSESLQSIGHPLDVDWLNIIADQGLQIVNCRL